jgi:hypothetical protein
MARKTRRDLVQVAAVINNQLKLAGDDRRVTIEWAYGQPRACFGDCTDLSPRLATGALYDWLCAFEGGLRRGIAIGERTGG